MKIHTPNKYIFLLSMLLLLILTGCSQTRYVPSGKYLINKVDINIDEKNINREEVKQQITQKENLRILGVVKFHLGMYNMSSKKKEDGWLKRIGEPPSIYNEFQSERSNKNLKTYLDNKGYYNAIVNDSVVYHKSKKKLKLVYSIEAGEPYRINNYEYKILDEHLESLILNDNSPSKVKAGDIFDIDELDNERKRISKKLKNNGYYAFNSNYIRFEADSALDGNLVDLKIIIGDAGQQRPDSIVRHKKYLINNYVYNTNFATGLSKNRTERRAARQDTLAIKNYQFVYGKKLRYKPELLYNVNHIKDSTYYSLNNVERTFESLNSLQQFKIVDINFKPTDEVVGDSIGYLDAQVNLSPLERQGFSVELEGTNSSGNLGVAGSFNYKHKNLFRGAEILNLNFRIARERQQTLISDEVVDFNTQEYGLEASITIPKFLSPVRIPGIFKYSVPQTVLTTGYNYQSRPDYTRGITTFQYGYNWKSSLSRTNTLNIFDWNVIDMKAYNEDFINSIEDLSIKSSYTDHLIMAMNFSSVNNPEQSNSRHYHYLRWSVESAGNLLSAFTNINKWNPYESVDADTGETEEYYRLLGIRFAQYLKGDIEVRYGYKINKYNSFVTRAFLGVALPYGNFDVTPFEKRYFSGGANSLRAWQVRTLGPGSYAAPDNAYPNQSADIKLEANIEYRYKLISFIEGAFFFDAGNIWAINDNDNREGAQFKFNEFYKQIALGTGVGLRFDFSYFVFRLDLGMKLVDPALDGKKFIIGNYPINNDHFNLNFAIGYPF